MYHARFSAIFFAFLGYKSINISVSSYVIRSNCVGLRRVDALRIGFGRLQPRPQQPAHLVHQPRPVLKLAGADQLPVLRQPPVQPQLGQGYVGVQQAF